jgi:hypothetical protein
MKMPNWLAACGRWAITVWRYFAGGQIKTESTPEPRLGVAKTVVNRQGNLVEIPECRTDIDAYMMDNHLGLGARPQIVAEIPVPPEEEKSLIRNVDFASFGSGNKPRPPRVHITDLTDLREQFRQCAPDIADGEK